MLKSKKWDFRFLKIAEQVSTWSKDPSAKIGAVTVLDRRVLSTGYNGFPKGIDDDPVRYGDRELKYKFVVHAEMNAIYNATKNGISLQDTTIYIWGLPICSECAKGIASVGIKRVVCAYDPDEVERWIDSFHKSLDILDECGIIVETIPMKDGDIYEFDG